LKTTINKNSDFYLLRCPVPQYTDNYIIVYWQNYYGLFRPFELVGLVVMLGEKARQKIAAKCRRIGRELNGLLQNPRPP
jgi:hypothetical protein